MIIDLRGNGLLEVYVMRRAVKRTPQSNNSFNASGNRVAFMRET
jgi:hypothetical protein